MTIPLWAQRKSPRPLFLAAKIWGGRAPWSANCAPDSGSCSSTFATCSATGTGSCLKTITTHKFHVFYWLGKNQMDLSNLLNFIQFCVFPQKHISDMFLAFFNILFGWIFLHFDSPIKHVIEDFQICRNRWKVSLVYWLYPPENNFKLSLIEIFVQLILQTHIAFSKITKIW